MANDTAIAVIYTTAYTVTKAGLLITGHQNRVGAHRPQPGGSQAALSASATFASTCYAPSVSSATPPYCETAREQLAGFEAIVS